MFFILHCSTVHNNNNNDQIANDVDVIYGNIEGARTVTECESQTEMLAMTPVNVDIVLYIFIYLCPQDKRQKSDSEKREIHVSPYRKPLTQLNNKITFTDGEKHVSSRHLCGV